MNAAAAAAVAAADVGARCYSVLRARVCNITRPNMKRAHTKKYMRILYFRDAYATVAVQETCSYQCAEHKCQKTTISNT